MKYAYKKDYFPPGPCTCANIRRASLAITGLYDQILAPTGLKITQYSLLRHLKKLSPVTMTGLAKAIKLDRTTLARNLKYLSKDGLVSIVPGEDSRTREVSITDKGLQALEAATPLWQETQALVKEYMGEEKLSALSDLLAEIAALRVAKKS